MADSAEPNDASSAGEQSRRYGAFISYSHADEAFARRLQRRLEAYRLPRRVTAHAAATAQGPRLKPIFRDAVELSASHDLTAAVREALAASDYLIVVCSPAAAQSKWVGREIELFRHLHGERRILTALIDGEPEEAFHAALKRRPHGRATEPLAADFRPRLGNGRVGLLKLVAPMAGVSLDDLIHREGQREVRRLAAVASGAVAGVAVLAVLAVIALAARNEAAVQSARASRLGDFMTSDLRKGLEAAGRHDLLDQVNRAAMRSYKSESASRVTPEQTEQQAKLLQGIGKDAEKRGDLAAARAQFETAYKMTGPLVAADAHDPRRLFAHAQSEYWVGFLSWREGNAPAAKAHLEAYARMADRLVATDPANDEWRMERVYSAQNLGILAMRQAGDPVRAETYFHAALAELDTIARHKPSDPDVTSERQAMLAWLADSQRLQGHLREATATREAQKQVLEALLSKNPRNVEAKRHLLAHDLAVARIVAAEGSIDHAISLLAAGHAKALALEADDPDNKDFPKQARMFELFDARYRLGLLPQKRPPAKKIAATLGDCAPRGPGADNQEISDFCGVLLARLHNQQGKRAEAEAALAVVQRRAAARHETLTARWGLNLADEARPVQVDDHSGGTR